MRVSIRTKTIVGIAAIECVLLSILIISAISFLTDIIDETLSKRAKTTSALFATTTKDALLAYDLASLESFTEELMQNPDMSYVRVVGSNGELFASMGEKDLLERTFTEDQQLGDVSDGVFDTSAEISEGGSTFGRVELGLSIASTQEKIQRVQIWSATLGFLELILVAAFSYVFGTYLTRQLGLLNTGSKKVKRALKTRDFQNVKVVVRGHDELSELAVSFNGLVELLQEELLINKAQQNELEALNSELELKVAKRTETLNVRNQELLDINKEMQETQRQLLQAEKMASVGQLAAGVAHEINNPVGFVASNLSTLKDYVGSYRMLSSEVTSFVQLDETQQAQGLIKLRECLGKEDFAFVNDDVTDLLDESEEGLKRVTDIVAGLKLFSRADTDETQLFDLNVCLKTTLNMVNNELKYHCKVETHFQEIPQIAIHVGKINQVFTNLLVNAGHAIKSTGKFGLLTLSSALQKDYIEIKIQDTGVGMDENTLTQIFNPFFTTKPEGSGTGLGLSISFGIIADHDGELSATSKVNEGSCFTIKLPINSSKETI